jgi:DNA-binding transcriptional LysR family regulator
MRVMATLPTVEGKAASATLNNCQFLKSHSQYLYCRTVAALPHLSTDQVAAFVELSRVGQIRAAAEALSITEQGVRNRLIALEAQLGVELYRKCRGPRRAAVLTPQGRRFLPHALAFLERAHELCRVCDLDSGGHEIRVVASQYLTRYVLIDVLKGFRAVEPSVHVRVSTMKEDDVAVALRDDPEVAFGLAAPYEAAPELVYHELFAMNWSLITPIRGPIAVSVARVALADLQDHPLIVYERGSTGRQHVLDAFAERGLAPRVALETTSTETVVSMVEAGLGLAIVPLLSNGAVTRGRRVRVVGITDALRPIHSGLLIRRGEKPAAKVARLIEFTRSKY